MSREQRTAVPPGRDESERVRDTVERVTVPEQHAQVLVVDDHPVFRRGLVTLLAGESWVDEVHEAATVADAVRAATEQRVDAVAMDVRLPDGDGIEATAAVLRARPGAAVLLLTMVGDPEMVVRGLRAGARGYVLKDSDPDLVGRALRVVRDGGLVLGPGVADDALTTLRLPPAETPAPFDRLTPRELDVVGHLAEGHTNQRIARDLGVHEKTVRNVVSEILAKLHAADRVEVALQAREAGLAAPQER